MRPMPRKSLIVALAIGGFPLGQGGPAWSQTQAAPLNLTGAQRQTIWQYVWRSSGGVVPIGYEASVGATVPGAIKLQALPLSIVDLVPSVKTLEYARTRNEILIVDPLNRKVVSVIHQ